MKMTSLEEDLTISKEDNLAGQDTHRKTTSQEVSLTGRPQKRQSQSHWKTTPLDDGLNKRK